MEKTQQEFADQGKEHEDLADISENMRPPMESGVGSNVEEEKEESAEGQNQKEEDGPPLAIPENMRPPLQSGGSSTVEPRSNKSTEIMKQPVEDLNDSLPSGGNLNIEEEKGQPEEEEAAAAVGGKRKRHNWDYAAVIALLDAHEKQSKQNWMNIDWEEIANDVNNASDKPVNTASSGGCKAKFDKLTTERWSQESITTIQTKSLKDWYVEKVKRQRPPESGT